MEMQLKKRLEEAEARYQAGDYRMARQLARELDDDPAIKETDRDRVHRILESTKTDPVVIMAMIFSFCLLVFLVLKYAL